MKYDAAVYVGRFQPFHLAHLTLLQHAFTLADRVVVGLGSAQLDRSLKNPWTPGERIDMIRPSLTPEQQERVRFVELVDFGNMQKWCDHVAAQVSGAIWPLKNVCLTTVRKDASTEYVDYLGWAFEQGPTCPNMSATMIRAAYFGGFDVPIWGAFVPPATIEVLRRFQHGEHYTRLANEWRATP